MSRRVALSFNSSFLGYFAHAGFLRALLASGVRPVAVGGASAGALVAGLFAAGIEPAEMLELFLSPELQTVFREPGAPWRGLATILNLPGHTGAIRGERAAALLRTKLGQRRIEECTAARLSLSVTNLTEARTEAVTSGPLADLILASGAFPVSSLPVRRGIPGFGMAVWPIRCLLITGSMTRKLTQSCFMSWPIRRKSSCVGAGNRAGCPMRSICPTRLSATNCSA